jgi:hypothetical protein
MKKIFDSCLILICKAVGMTSLFFASMATGTISLMGPYEPEMPAALSPKDGEESE